MAESDSDSDSEEGILSFFQTQDKVGATQPTKRKSPGDLFAACNKLKPSAAAPNSPEPKRAKAAQPSSKRQPIQGNGAVGSVVDSRAFFEGDDAKEVVGSKDGQTVSVTMQLLPSIFECHICLRRLRLSEKETDMEQIVFVYPTEKPTIEVCMNCLRRDKHKAQKLDRVNNKVEYNLAAKCLMPTACKVCGSYEHGSYECMIPQASHHENAAAEQGHDPTAPYR